MPSYTQLSTETIGVMQKNVESLKKEIDTLKKNKGDKKAIAALEKTYTEKGKALGAKFAADMKIAEAGCKAMSVQVDAYLGEANKSVSAIKAAVEKYKKTNDKSQLLVAEHGAGYIKTVADLAAKEMDTFAVSWDKYRQYNAGLPEFTKEGAAIRQAVMDLTKVCRGKVTKIETMVPQAQSFANVAKMESAQELPSPEAKRAEAQKLASSLREMAKAFEGKGGMEATMRVVESFGDKFKDPKTLKLIVPEAEKLYKFTVSSVQSFTTTLSAMKKTLATGKQAIPAMYLKDGATAASLKTCDDAILHWETQVKKSQVGLNQMAKQLTDAQNKAKTLK